MAGGGPGGGAKRYPDHTVSGQNGIREETERPSCDERSVDINMLICNDLCQEAT